MEFDKLRHIIFFGALTLISILFVYMIKPFAYPIFWAAIIAGIFHPLYKILYKLLKNKNIGAMITLVIIFAVIILPLTLLTTLIATESVQLYKTYGSNSGQIAGAVQNATNWIKHNTITATFNIDEKFWTEKFSEATQIISEIIFNAVKNITQNSLSFLVQFVLMLYTLFFFLRDGEKILKFLMHLCPLGDKHEKFLYKKFTSTTSATLKGTIVVGAVQGALGAVLFWFTGIDGIFIWGLAMAIASIIPPFGTSIIWFPAGIFMLLSGNIWQGITILISGFLIISTVDNLIRPILVGRSSRIHPVIILFSTLGGLLLFGISGLVMGPVIASLFMAFWEMYSHYYQHELNENNEDGL